MEEVKKREYVPLSNPQKNSLILDSPYYMVRLDDFALNMDWQKFDRAKTIFHTYRIKPLIAVIPDNQDPGLLALPACPTSFWAEVRSLQRSGWGIGLHGYQHLQRTQSRGLHFPSIRPSEFSGLSYHVQLEMLEYAKSIFDRNRVRTNVFVAPWHSFDRETIRALKQIEIFIISDGLAIYPYFWEGMLFVPQLVEKPRAFLSGIHTFCFHLNSFDEKDFEYLDSFLTKYHHRFISFDEGSRRAVPGMGHLWNRGIGRILDKLLQTKRWIRKYQ